MREGGGFHTSWIWSIMIGQIQLVHITDPCRARFDILARKAEILALANRQSISLLTLGGGAQDVEVRLFERLMVAEGAIKPTRAETLLAELHTA